MPAPWWIVSVPRGNGNVLQQCNGICMSEDSQCADFPVPDLKVKNLSSLMNLTDDMQKYEERTEATLKRLVRNYDDLKPPHPLMIEDSRGTKKPDAYMKSFEWDERKYMAKQDLAGLASGIYSEIADMDNDVKNKQAELTSINSRLNAIQRKRSGNLVSRDLSDLIKSDHLRDIHHGSGIDGSQCPAQFKGRMSEKIVPYWVVVSKHREKDFLDSYERFTKFVVPGSALKVASEDKDYSLFRILHLNVPALEDDLKQSVEGEPNKFVLRQFTFEHQANEASTQEERELLQKQEHSKREVIAAIRTNFSEMFMGWFHLKAIRVFVESVLWYSLPPNFQVMIIAPNENRESSLRDKLALQFKDAKCAQSSMSSPDEEDNYPYVNLDLDLDWLFGDK